jgi:Fe-S cluster assembly protein SufB
MSRFAPITVAKPQQNIINDNYSFGFSDPTDDYVHISKPGLSRGVVQEISSLKHEPAWMLELRLKALERFEGMVMPLWGADLSRLTSTRFGIATNGSGAAVWTMFPTT